MSQQFATADGRRENFKPGPVGDLNLLQRVLDVAITRGCFSDSESIVQAHNAIQRLRIMVHTIPLKLKGLEDGQQQQSERPEGDPK
jgi:hypothetical protein